MTCTGGSCRKSGHCETPAACEMPEPTKPGWDWQLIAIYVAVAICFIWVLILSAVPITN